MPTTESLSEASALLSPTSSLPLDTSAKGARMALHLPAHTLADEARSPILGVSFNSSGSSSFATATTEGWVVYRTDPLEVLSRRGRYYRHTILQLYTDPHAAQNSRMARSASCCRSSNPTCSSSSVDRPLRCTHPTRCSSGTTNSAVRSQNSSSGRMYEDWRPGGIGWWWCSEGGSLCLCWAREA